MKDLDLSNAEGLDESITENYSAIAPRFGTVQAAAPRQAAAPSLNLAPQLNANPTGVGSGVAAIALPDAIKVNSANIAPTVANPTGVGAGVAGIALPDAIKNVPIKNEKIDAINLAVDDIKSTRPVPAQLEAEKEAEKKESSAEESTEKTSEKTETEGDKILGMPKMVAYGLGAVIVLVGGFIAYKKFKK